MENHSRSKVFSNVFDESKIKESKDKSAVELRRNKRDELSSKRRNIDAAPVWVSLSDHYPPTYSIEDLPDILLSFQHPDDTSLLFIAQAVRKILCNKEESYIEEICQTEVISHIPQWLNRYDHTQLQYEAAWICTNIASSERCSLLCEIAALAPLVSLLASDRLEIRGISAWALGNVAANSSEERDALIGLGTLQGLVQALNCPIKPKEKANTIWAITNVLRKKPLPEFDTVRSAFSVILPSLNIKTAYPLVDILWAINGYILNPEITEYLTSKEVVGTLVSILSVKDKEVKLMGCKIIGGICAGSGVHVQILLEANVTPSLSKLVYSKKSSALRKEAAWAFANICSETDKQLDYLLNAKVFERIIECAERDSVKVRGECAWVLCNASAVARPDQMVKLVEFGVLRALVSLLDDGDKIRIIVLQGIKKILDCGQLFQTSNGINLFSLNLENNGGFNVIAQLQFHENGSISQNAARIIEMLHPGNLEDKEECLMEEVKEEIRF